MNKQMRKKGFTLIELLVVIAIIALLVSILLPSLEKAKELARTTKCTVQMKNIGTATAIYMSQNDGLIPCLVDIYGQLKDNPSYGSPTMTMPEFFEDEDLIEDEAMFSCPNVQDSVREMYGYDYVYNSYSANVAVYDNNKTPRTIEGVYDPERANLVSDYSFTQHSKGDGMAKNMLYLDWHVEMMSYTDYLDFGTWTVWRLQGWDSGH